MGGNSEAWRFITRPTKYSRISDEDDFDYIARLIPSNRLFYIDVSCLIHQIKFTNSKLFARVFLYTDEPEILRDTVDALAHALISQIIYILSQPSIKVVFFVDGEVTEETKPALTKRRAAGRKSLNKEILKSLGGILA
jgi:hypothetical protein